MYNKENISNPFCFLQNFQRITDALLEWYSEYQRKLPWRAISPCQADPYKVWVSEIMLQQTTVSTVQPYFLKFIKEFPSVQPLSAAHLDKILTLWSGLGYYKRAVNLHQTAKALNSLMPHWPKTPEEWKSFPGIGPYTAAAISAIAFDFPIIPVDGNVVRIVSRLFDFYTQKQTQKLKYTQNIAQNWQKNISSSTSWNNLAQSLMDFGSLICRPQSPLCPMCPFQNTCAYTTQSSYELDPRVSASFSKRSLRFSYALCFINSNNEIYLEKETKHNLLNGLMKTPLIDISHKNIKTLVYDVRHVFSHIEWYIHILKIPYPFSKDFRLSNAPQRILDEIKNIAQNIPEKNWYSSQQINSLPLSSFMRKILQKIWN